MPTRCEPHGRSLIPPLAVETAAEVWGDIVFVIGADEFAGFGIPEASAGSGEADGGEDIGAVRGENRGHGADAGAGEFADGLRGFAIPKAG